MSKPNLSVGTKIWADKINAAWRQSAAEIINAGKLLLQAKEAVRHGEFENMIKMQLDFTPQMARKIMAIARDERIVNRAHERALPDHWTTLYELTKLSDDELDQAFSSGVIGPKMQRADVPKRRKESPQGDAAPQLDSGTPQTDAKGEDSAVIYYDEPEAQGDLAASKLANGLAWAMAASLVLTPYEAAQQWPVNIPLPAQDLRDFTNWLLAFEDERANAVLQSAVAE